MHRNRVSGVWLLAGITLLSGCTAIRSHWPFARAVRPGPQPVSELVLKLPAEGAAPVVLQFWERNTLIVDLQNVASAGQVVLTRSADKRWPARIAVRMASQRFEVLEVRGAQRIVLPVASGTAGTVTAELPPGTYDETTPALTLSWGARGAF